MNQFFYSVLGVALWLGLAGGAAVAITGNLTLGIGMVLACMLGLLQLDATLAAIRSAELLAEIARSLRGVAGGRDSPGEERQVTDQATRDEEILRRANAIPEATTPAQRAAARKAAIDLERMAEEAGRQEAAKRLR